MQSLQNVWNYGKDFCLSISIFFLSTDLKIYKMAKHQWHYGLYIDDRDLQYCFG